MKRLFDFSAGLFGLVILWPALAALAIWIKLSSPGPVLYRGKRAGRDGVPFRIMKFRSMVVDAENLGGPSSSGDDPRITRVGDFMRRFKLDELPQLINVLIGEMSLVGPRPEVLSEVEGYTDEQRGVLALRPGITDWASIWNADEGAVLAGAEDPHAAYKELIQPTKLELQLKYLRERSFFVDLKILLYTVLRLFRKDWLPRELESYGRLMPPSSTNK